MPVNSILGTSDVSSCLQLLHLCYVICSENLGNSLVSVKKLLSPEVDLSKEKGQNNSKVQKAHHVASGWEKSPCGERLRNMTRRGKTTWSVGKTNGNNPGASGWCSWGDTHKPSLHHNKRESRENWDVFLSNWFESLQFQHMMVCSIFKVV